MYVHVVLFWVGIYIVRYPSLHCSLCINVLQIGKDGLWRTPMFTNISAVNLGEWLELSTYMNGVTQRYIMPVDVWNAAKVGSVCKLLVCLVKCWITRKAAISAFI